MTLTIRQQTLAMLDGASFTRREIREALGCAHSTLSVVIYSLHEQKKIHICKWEPRPGLGPYEAVWTVGNKKDAKRPARITKSEQSRRYRAKHKHRLDALKRARRGEAINPFEQLMWAAQ
jgi:hypothetical protein